MFLKQKKNISNFSIIAHCDHGKSTLAKSILDFANNANHCHKLRKQIFDSM